MSFNSKNVIVDNSFPKNNDTDDENHEDDASEEDIESDSSQSHRSTPSLPPSRSSSVEMPMEEDDAEAHDNSDGSKKNIILEVEHQKTLLKKPVKQYINKAGTFFTGIDPLSEDTKIKAEERTRRFGQVVRPENIVTREVLIELYKSLGVKGPKELTESKLETKNGDNVVDDDVGDVDDVDHIRYNSIHMNGTDDLSTDDIFKYFAEFPAQAVEWINDHSCNILWAENVSAARAMLKLSSEIKKEEEEEDAESADTAIVSDIADRSVPEEHEEMEVDNDFDVDRRRRKSSDITERKSKDDGGDVTTKIDSTSKLIEPLPNGKWRLGKPARKSQRQLLMRFATKDDKKELGAAAKSKYYQKHGNPNFGGIKGIVSKSWRQRYLTKRDRNLRREVLKEMESLEWKRGGVPEETTFDRHVTDVEKKRKMSIVERIDPSRKRVRRSRENDVDGGSCDDADDNDDTLVVEDVPAIRRTLPKRPRMKMYADDEEEDERSGKGVRERISHLRQREKGVWERLGQARNVQQEETRRVFRPKDDKSRDLHRRHRKSSSSSSESESDRKHRISKDLRARLH